jgi:nicotinate-nucleotide pyrophosphorylase (carboxylating)
MTAHLKTVASVPAAAVRPSALPEAILGPLVAAALAEDLGRAGDITAAATVPADATARVAMAARRDGVICGLGLAVLAFRQMDATLEIEQLAEDGARVAKGDAVLRISGNARAILAAERVALNFVGRLSGIATATAVMVAAVGHQKARIAATRKTTPGLRAVEKYAVICGGGTPHRYGLDDAILIKDNHIAFAGGVRQALRGARNYAGHTVKVEIEVDTLAQLDEVLDEGGADIVMLDNMSDADMREAVRRVAGRALIEASGGVTLERIAVIAATGVDLISVGALTHSVINFDVGLDAL